MTNARVYSQTVGSSTPVKLQPSFRNETFMAKNAGGSTVYLHAGGTSAPDPFDFDTSYPMEPSEVLHTLPDGVSNVDTVFLWALCATGSSRIAAILGSES